MADVRLTFDADTRAAESSVSDLAQQADDLAAALDGVDSSGRDADAALDDLARSADDAADAARDLTDDLDAIEDAAPSDIGRQMGDDLEDGFKRASDGAEGFKDEANQSAREGAASFTGEFDDVAGFIQETLANALSGFGPVGAAAGLAAAAGLGILISSLQASAEEAEESKERIIDLADQIREVDGDLSRLNTDQIFLDWSGQISDTKQWFELWQDAPQTNIEQLATAADELGVSMDYLVTALRDVDGPEAAAVEDLLNNRLGTGGWAVSASTDAATQSLITLRGALNDGSLDATEAAELYGLQEEALGGLTAQTEYATEATETYNESVQDSLSSAGESWEEYTENGITDLDAYAQAMEDQISAVQSYQENMETVSSTLSDNALSYLQNMGVEAAPLLEQFVNAPTEQQDRIAAIWDQLGTTAVDGYGDGLGGLTSTTNTAVADATENANAVQIGYQSSSDDAQTAVNRALSRVSTPLVRIRYSDTNAVGVRDRRA